MAGALAAGVAVPGFARARGHQSESYLVEVPESLPAKVYESVPNGISKKTHDNHLKLWQGYAKKTNEIRTALKDLARTTDAPNQVYSEMRALKANYAFAWGGYINHMVYFNCIGKGGGKPVGQITALIDKSFGSYENWEKDFKATCTAARGWVYVAVDNHSGQLINMLGDAQDTFPLWGHTLIMACDVYEHAYYFDFGSDRGAYVDAFLKSVDWMAVSEMYEEAFGM